MIGTVLKISWINLRRDRVALVLSFVLPLVFFSIFAGVFRGMDEGSTRDVEIFVVLEDRHPDAVRFAELLRDVPRLATVGAAGRSTREDALGAVRSGLADAAVVVPAGFGDALRRASAPAVDVQIFVDTSNPLAASMVTGALRSMSLELGLEMLAATTGFVDRVPARLSFEVVDVLGRSGKQPSVAFFASGIGVMFLMFAVSGRSAILLDESGVLVRMLSARLGMTRLLAGRWIFLTLLGIVQVTAMFVWGALFFGLELWVPRHLLGFAVLTPVTAATAAGFGLVLSTLCRSRTQLNGVAAVVILILSALGGNMFPGFLMPEGLRTLGLATFNAWALAGYQKIFWYEQSVLQLVPQLAVLAVFCASFLVLARVLARRWEHA